jgi:signal peptidase I
MKGIIREILITLGLAVAIYLILQTSIQSSIVNNVSMQPTLVAGQRIIVLKSIYNFKEPERGDIIIIHPPVAPQEEWVKRLIGLPGDTIAVKGGIVYVNGVPLDEPYVKDKAKNSFGPFEVPAGNYFVMGDNRNNSTDSRFGWTVTRNEIVGEAWFRIWPLSKFGGVGNFPLNEQVESSQSAPSPISQLECPVGVGYN